MLDRRSDGSDKRAGPAPRVIAGDDAIDTRHRQCPARIYRQDLGMGARRAQDRGVQRPRRQRQIAGIAAAAGQQWEVLEPFERSADACARHPVRHRFDASAGLPGHVSRRSARQPT